MTAKKKTASAKLVSRVIEVKQYITLTLDESKFDEKFMQEFRDSFYPFFTTAEHAEHIGQMIVRGVSGGKYDPKTGGLDFVEGYGPPAEMGITVDSWGYWENDAEVFDTFEPDAAKKRVRR